MESFKEIQMFGFYRFGAHGWQKNHPKNPKNI